MVSSFSIPLFHVVYWSWQWTQISGEIRALRIWPEFLEMFQESKPIFEIIFFFLLQL